MKKEMTSATEEWGERTVGSLVAERWARADVLKANGIDFCCGGKASLAAACALKGVDLQLVVSAIQAADTHASLPAQDFSKWTIPHLVSYLLEHHHDYIREQAPLIIAYGTRVGEVHGHAAPEAVQALQIFIRLSDELHGHLPKEEMVLFPSILRNAEMGLTHRRDPLLAGPIHVMEAEHDAAGELLHALEHVTNGFTPPDWACNTFRVFYAKLSDFHDRLLEHVHLENNVLFPQVV